MGKIITISREFGSGGRELGKRLADVLGYDYYDKEIIEEISKNKNLDKDYVEKCLDNQFWKSVPLSFGRTFTMIKSNTIRDNLLISVQEILLDIARSDKDCVIVGRNADIILNEYNPFKIFVYADIESKINRCIERMDEKENKTRKNIEHQIKSIDKSRMNSREILTDINWKDLSQYHIAINTTDWDLKQLANTLSNVINNWFMVK